MSMKDSQEIHSISKRVDSLEDDMKTLTKSVGGLEVDVQNIKQDVTSINNSLSNIGRRIEKLNEPKWSIILGVSTLLIAIMSGINYMVLEPIKSDIRDNVKIRRRMWDTVERNQVSISKHKTGYGHKTIEVLLHSLDKRIDNLERKTK